LKSATHSSNDQYIFGDPLSLSYK